MSTPVKIDYKYGDSRRWKRNDDYLWIYVSFSGKFPVTWGFNCYQKTNTLFIYFNNWLFLAGFYSSLLKNNRISAFYQLSRYLSLQDMILRSVAGFSFYIFCAGYCALLNVMKQKIVSVQINRLSCNFLCKLHIIQNTYYKEFLRKVFRSFYSFKLTLFTSASSCYNDVSLYFDVTIDEIKCLAFSDNSIYN